jgi:hypothetical protein
VTTTISVPAGIVASAIPYLRKGEQAVCQYHGVGVRVLEILPLGASYGSAVKNAQARMKTQAEGRLVFVEQRLR